MNGFDLGFSIDPCDDIKDIDSQRGYKKLKLTSSQKIRIGGLFQQAPSFLATSELSKAYVVRFPEGVSKSCHLMNYKNGGVGTPIQGPDGEIMTHASFHEMNTQAAVMSAFSVMAVVSGQYFLSQINNELKAINQSIDRILEFLYGDKKAELMAELSFVKYAYQYYNSIMDYNEQRIATITSLQEAKKVAMKDLEFYMSDLDSTVNSKSESDVSALTKKMIQIKECLELSMQLYVMANLMEVYYSENDDADYIHGLEQDTITYVGKCEKRILSCFSMLRSHIQSAKDGIMRKIDKTELLEKTDSIIGVFSEGTETELCRSLRSALHAREQKVEYYVSKNNDVYLKVI